MVRNVRRELTLIHRGASEPLRRLVRAPLKVRQRLLDIRPFRDEAGIRRCHLVLEPVFVLTRPQPRRPFQGWRYLYPADAPADFGDGDPTGAMPMALRRDLVELGLL